MPKSTMSMLSTQSSNKNVKISQSPQVVKKGTDELAKQPLDLSIILQLPGPKKPESGYEMFVKEQMAKLDKLDKNDQQVLKKITNFSDDWKALGQFNLKFELLAYNDNDRYQNQCKELEQKGFYTMADGKQSNHVLPQNPQFLEHVLQPKKPSSTFYWFSSTYRKQQFKENPKIKVKDINKTIFPIWSKIKDFERRKFEEMAQKDQLRFENELNELFTLGYFILPDGSKSCERQQIVKKKREIRQKSHKELEIDQIMSDDEEIMHQKSIKSPKSTKLSKVKPVAFDDKPKSSKSKEKKIVDQKLSNSKSPQTTIIDENLQKLSNSKSEEKMLLVDVKKLLIDVQKLLVDQKPRSESMSKAKEQTDENPNSIKSSKGKSPKKSESAADSKKKLSPLKNSKIALKSPKRQPSPEKSQKANSPSKIISQGAIKQKRQKSPEQPRDKKAKLPLQTLSQISKVVSTPKIKKKILQLQKF